MIHQGVLARIINFEFRHRRTAGATVTVCTPFSGSLSKSPRLWTRSKIFANDMEGRGEVRPTDTEPDPHGFADLCLERLVL